MKTNTLTAQMNDLKEFYQEVLTDSDLPEQLKAAKNLESIARLAMKLGAERGYNFSEKGLQALIAIICDTDLEEEELDSFPEIFDFFCAC